jgi:hypothetical protein
VKSAASRYTADRASRASTAISSLESSVDSARCVNHLTGLVNDLIPHERRGAPVTDVVNRANHLIKATATQS